MTDASKTRVSFIAETTYGAGQAATVALEEFRYTNCSLAPVAGYISSNEIADDRQPRDQVRTSFTAAGDIGFELAHNSKWSGAMVGAMMSTAPLPSHEATVTATDISFVATDNSVNSGASAFTVAAGDWVYITGSTANPDFVAKVVTATTSKLILSGYRITAESAGASITVDHRQHRVTGTTLRSFKFEIEPTGDSGLFQVYTGVVVAGASIDFPATGIMTGSMSLTAQDCTAQASTSGTGTITAASTNSVMNTESHFEGLLMGGPEGTQNAIASTTDYASQTASASSSSGLLLTYATDWQNLTKVRFTTSGTLPTGLSTGTDYWLVRVDPVTARVSTSLYYAENAVVIAYTDAGTGTHTMVPQEPVVVTTSTAHGVHTGDLIMIEGSSESGLNTTWLATRINSTRFSLDGATSSTAAAATSSSGTFRKLKIAVAMVSGNFTINNATRDRTQAGVLGPISKGLGQFNASGTLRLYYSSQRQFGRFIADDYTGLAFVTKDSSGNVYVFEFPKVKFTSAPTVVGGNDQDVVVEVAWSAVRESVDDLTFKLAI